jgi:hypothetical protein
LINVEVNLNQLTPIKEEENDIVESGSQRCCDGEEISMLKYHNKTLFLQLRAE